MFGISKNRRWWKEILEIVFQNSTQSTKAEGTQSKETQLKETHQSGGLVAATLGTGLIQSI